MKLLLVLTALLLSSISLSVYTMEEEQSNPSYLQRTSLMDKKLHFLMAYSRATDSLPAQLPNEMVCEIFKYLPTPSITIENMWQYPIEKVLQSLPHHFDSTQEDYEKQCKKAKSFLKMENTSSIDFAKYKKQLKTYCTTFDIKQDFFSNHSETNKNLYPETIKTQKECNKIIALVLQLMMLRSKQIVENSLTPRNKGLNFTQHDLSLFQEWGNLFKENISHFLLSKEEILQNKEKTSTQLINDFFSRAGKPFNADQYNKVKNTLTQGSLLTRLIDYHTLDPCKGLICPQNFSLSTMCEFFEVILIINFLYKCARYRITASFNSSIRAPSSLKTSARILLELEEKEYISVIERIESLQGNIPSDVRKNILIFLKATTSKESGFFLPSKIREKIIEAMHLKSRTFTQHKQAVMSDVNSDQIIKTLVHAQDQYRKEVQHAIQELVPLQKKLQEEEIKKYSRYKKYAQIAGVTAAISTAVGTGNIFAKKIVSPVWNLILLTTSALGMLAAGTYERIFARKKHAISNQTSHNFVTYDPRIQSIHSLITGQTFIEIGDEVISPNLNNAPYPMPGLPLEYISQPQLPDMAGMPLKDVLALKS